jgi:hypothetical protein
MTRGTAALTALALAAGATASAQVPWDRFGGGFRRVPPKFATADTFDGSFNFCRVMYRSVWREPGGMGWWTDYPDSDINFSTRLSELTRTPVGRDAQGEFKHVVVRLTDEALFQCPFVVIEDVGTVSFDDQEAEALQTYLRKGGFLWADDFWGSRAWEVWTRELARVLPPGEFPIVEVTAAHPMFHTLFDLEEIPQVPSIQFWRRSGGETSERGSDSARPNVRGIVDASGRLMVLMTHNTDVSDAWEREGEESEFFYRFSVDGYAVGIDVVLYAMTH